MKFWDSSAIVPLVIRESATTAITELHGRDARVVACWSSSVEVWAAIARRRREGVLRSPDVRAARERLLRLREDWAEVEDVESIRSRAMRLVEVHPLRAADAVQLAAALVVVQDRPDGFPFVTLDDRLAQCAEAEGFRIEPLPKNSPSQAVAQGTSW